MLDKVDGQCMSSSICSRALIRYGYIFVKTIDKHGKQVRVDLVLKKAYMKQNDMLTGEELRIVYNCRDISRESPL
jgi:hypothetical protein